MCVDRNLSCGSWGLIGFVVVLLPSVALGELPATVARASVAVQSAGGETPDKEVTGPLTASSSASLPDATAAAESTVQGDLKSRALAGGASGQQGPFRGHAESQWIAQLVATGTDPGAPIDVDVSFSVDGSLTYADNNSGAGPGDILAGVSFELAVHDNAGEIVLWSGDATVGTADGFPNPPDFSRNGDWADPAHDGDFDTDNLRNIGVNSMVSIDDAFSVSFGESFSLDAELVATAFSFATFESEAGAEFFDTGNVTISTGTPGVTFEVIIIPEPATLVMFLWGAVWLARRPRRSA